MKLVTSLMDGILPLPPRTPDHAAVELVSLLTASARPCTSCGIKWADDWSPSALLRLPLAWWQTAADLWNSILKLNRVPRLWNDAEWHCCGRRARAYSSHHTPHGRVPRLWKDGRVALLWKTCARTRPITLLTAISSGELVRVLQTQLAPWILTRGGLQGTWVAGAFMQIQKSHVPGLRPLFVQMDVGP